MTHPSDVKTVEELAKKHLESLGFIPKRGSACYDTVMRYEIKKYVVDSFQAGYSAAQAKADGVIAELKKDSERLQWMIEMIVNPYMKLINESKGWRAYYKGMAIFKNHRNTAREAIDAAMKKIKE